MDNLPYVLANDPSAWSAYVPVMLLSIAEYVLLAALWCRIWIALGKVIEEHTGPFKRMQKRDPELESRTEQAVHAELKRSLRYPVAAALLVGLVNAAYYILSTQWGYIWVAPIPAGLILIATTYTAQFEAVLNQYTVVFLDEDGTELDRQVVDYGTKPVYQGETPMKAEDEQYTYTFAGWYPAVVTVTKDATYRATYTAHDKSQGLWGVQDGEPSSTKIIRNGTLYILRAGKTYTTDGVMVEQ